MKGGKALQTPGIQNTLSPSLPQKGSGREGEVAAIHPDLTIASAFWTGFQILWFKFLHLKTTGTVAKASGS